MRLDGFCTNLGRIWTYLDVPASAALLGPKN
jgi:hypothetical protein